MSKITLLAVTLVVLMISFSGCGTDAVQVQEDFNTILEKTANEDSIQEASDYIDQHLSRVNMENASEMLVSYENYVLAYDFAGIDYNQWIDRYEKYADPALIALYRLKAKAQQFPIAKDAILLVGWDELAERAHEVETFITEFKDSQLIKEDATWMYGNYINTMLMGTTGTPVFDYKTKKYSDEARAAYSNFMNKYPDSTTAWVLREYSTYLKSINYTMNYNDKVSSKLYFDTCNLLVSESGKRVFQ